jgi:hypothetical protein
MESKTVKGMGEDIEATKKQIISEFDKAKAWVIE